MLKTHLTVTLLMSTFEVRALLFSYGTAFFPATEKDNMNLRVNRFWYSDFFVTIFVGEQVISGSQRIHEYELLMKRAAEFGFDMNPITDYLRLLRFVWLISHVSNCMAFR